MKKLVIILFLALALGFSTLGHAALTGDVNGDGNVTLADAILAIQLATGMVPVAGAIQEGYAPSAGDVNGDGKIGLEEAVYALQVASVIRVDPTSSPKVTATISAPAAQPGALPMLTWNVEGDRTGASLEIRALAPATPTLSALRPFYAGVSPAVGAVSYLTPGGAWQGESVPYQTPAGSHGLIPLTLASQTEGEWRFEVVLRGASGEILGFSAKTVVVSSTPALRLQLSRTVGIPGDELEASVTLSQGTTPIPVRLLAWITAPDGTTEPLPSGARLAYDGLSSNREIALAKRPLGTVGTWRVDAVLFNADTDAVLAKAFGTVTLCDQPAEVTGQVVSDTDAPLGAGATRAEVTFRPLSDFRGPVVATIDGGGNFSVNLSAGTWIPTAVVENGSGFWIATGSPLVVGGCGEAVTPLLLTSLPPFPGTPAAAMSTRAGKTAHVASAPPANSDNASDGNPRPNLVMYTAVNALNDYGKMMLLSEVFATRLSDGTNGDVNVATRLTLDAVESIAVLNQQLSGDGVAAALWTDALQRLAAGDVVLLFDVVRKASPNPDVPGDLAFRGAVAGPNGNNLRRAEVLVVAAQQGNESNFIQAVNQLAASLTGTDGTGMTLLQQIRVFQDFPVFPKLILSAPAEVTTGQSVTATVVLSDINGVVYSARKVTLEQTPTALGISASSTTDSHGSVTFTWTAGATGGQTLRASYYQKDGTGPFLSQPHVITVRPASRRVRFAPWPLKILQNAVAGFQALVKDAGEQAQPGAAVHLTGDVGGTAVDETVTADGTGVASIQVTAGSTEGVGHVTATVGGGGAPQVASQAAAPDAGDTSDTVYFTVGETYAFNFNASETDVLAGAVVTLAGSITVGDRPLGSTPVVLQLTGSGILEPSPATTDAEGVFGATFTAPSSGEGSAVITATFELAGETVQREVTVNWYDLGTVSLTFGASATSVTAGSSVTLNGSLTLGGTPLASASVDLAAAGGGGLSASTVETDQNGNFQATFNTPSSGSGQAVITATAQLGGGNTTQATVTVNWSPPIEGTPTTTITFQWNIVNANANSYQYSDQCGVAVGQFEPVGGQLTASTDFNCYGSWPLEVRYTDYWRVTAPPGVTEVDISVTLGFTGNIGTSPYRGVDDGVRLAETGGSIQVGNGDCWGDNPCVSAPVHTVGVMDADGSGSGALIFVSPETFSEVLTMPHRLVVGQVYVITFTLNAGVGSNVPGESMWSHVGATIGFTLPPGVSISSAGGLSYGSQ